MAESIVKSSTEAVLNVSKIGKTRVLHVDDDYAFLKVAKQCLEMQGSFQVDTASSVEEARKKMKKETYDVVVSDYMMPGKDGLQFLKELRQKGNSIPFIVFTGKGREEVVIKALNLGADHYENKNGNPETVYSELSHDIINAVRTRRVEQELRIQREELQVILDSMPAKIWYKDRYNRLVRVNKAFAEYMGASKENLEGKPLCDLFPPDIAQKCWEEDKEVITTGQPKTDIIDRHESPQGVRWFSTGKVPCREKDGNIIGTINFSVDITESKKAEKVLKKREAELSAIIENTSDSVWSIDNKGCLLFANTTFKRQFLLAYGVELKEGMDLKEMVPKVQVPFWVETHNAAIKGGRFSLERKLEIRGASVDFEISVNPIINENGETVGAAYFSRDITERKKAEEALRKSEGRWRSLAEGSPDHIMLLDLTGNILYINRTVPDLKREEVIGTSQFNYVPPEWHRAVKDCFKRVIETGKTDHYDTEYRTKDGEVRYFDVRIGPVFQEDRVVALISSSTDVTSQKKAGEKLRESEEKYRSLVELAPDGIATVNIEGMITSANRSFLTLVGYDSEEIVGKPFTELKTMRVEDIPKFQELFKSLMKGESPSPVEFLYIRKDRTSQWAEVHPSLLVKDGNPVGAQVIMRDVSERKNAEKLIREHQQKFEQLFMSNPEAAVYVDPNERVLNVNRRFTELFGYSFDEVKGKFLDDFVVPEDRRKEALMLAQKGREEYVCQETVRKNKEGSLFPVTMSSSPMVLQGQHLGDIVLYKDITERKKVEEEKSRLLHDLHERLKELNCLYGMSRFFEKSDISLDDVLQGTADLLPPAMQYPDITCARVVVEDREFSTKNFKETRWKLQADIDVFGKKAGFVEVCYLEERPTIAEGPFLKEERQLIDAVAERLGKIIQRKKVEEQLRDSKKKSRELFETSIDAIATSDMDGHFLDCNQSCQKMLGYSLDEMKELTYQQLTPEKWHEREAEIIGKEVMKKGYTAEYEKELIRKDGAIIPVSNRVWATFDDDGKPKAMWGIVRDITERKKAQEELRNSEERLNLMFELAPDAYYLNDLKGNFIDGNKAAEELTGYKKNELIGKSFLKLKMLPRSQALKAAKLLTMNALGKPTGPDEFVLNRKDGTQVPAEIRTHPVKIKGKTLVLGIARDISIRRKNEQTILENQQKFEGLFRHNPEAAVYLDLDSKVLDVNPRFCELFGYSAKEVEGKQINEVVVPEDMIEEAEKLDKDAKKGYASHDTVRKRKDGSLVHVSISASPVTVEGRLLGYVGVYKDITELKNAEERLKKINERLETTNEKLHVVGGLTRHDVRNKLSAVTGNAYLLKRKLTEDPKALEQLNDMEAAVRLVERIFEFARVYERLGVEQLASMDAGKAVNEAASLFSDLKGVKIVNECGGLTVLADSLLSQLFYNLVDNSLKYGEKIQQIKIHYNTLNADQLELVYEDDGVGIPDKMRSNLFKEGFTSGKGTGYGLFMIKRICEVYGWTIQETGKQGKGAQFSMLIPRTDSTGKANHQIQNPRQHWKEPETNTEFPSTFSPAEQSRNTVTTSDSTTQPLI